jgi:putative DNA primase/helicase
VGTRNTASTDLRTLEQNRFEAASLYRRRLVLISDTDKYGGSINVLKALTGQDPIRLERKNIQQNGTFRFDGQVLIASNEALATTDLTSGLERRRITVTFGRQATDSEREAWRQAGGEQAVLHSELPGIVNWALALSPEQVSAAIAKPPARTMAANLDALTAGNPVAGWLVECCAPQAGEWTQIGARTELRRLEDGFVHYRDAEVMLYPSYLAWSRRTGREPLAQRRFRHAAADMARTLGADVLEVRRADGQGIQGLRLIRHGEGPYPWSIGRSSVGSVGSSTAVQDEIGPEAAPVLEVQDVQDFRGKFTFVPAAHASPGHDDGEDVL